MPPKSQFLQIRVSATEKASIRRQARAAGMDLSAWILARSIPSARTAFQSLLRKLARGNNERYHLAALNDLLSELSASELDTAVATAEWRQMSPFAANYVAAMVELATHNKNMEAPAWTKDVPPPDTPWFAAALVSLRPHLLAASPVPFRRRNIFIDATLGDRV